jgi:hypothetical protein
VRVNTFLKKYGSASEKFGSTDGSAAQVSSGIHGRHPHIPYPAAILLGCPGLFIGIQEFSEFPHCFSPKYLL